MTGAPHVALATCAELPDLDPDDRLLVPALAALGVEAVPQIWDEPFTDWGAFDLVVVRNTWDYVGRREEFLTWARAVPRLVNRPEVLAWSTDKRYIDDLRAARLPVVPTLFLEPGDRFPELEAEVVVKPAESGGARDTQRHTAETEKDAVALVHRIHASGRTAMVQPYLRGVEDGRGETALIYLGGAFSHAIHKGALLTGAQVVRHGLFVQETIAPREPTSAERRVGDAVIDWVAGRFGAQTYARIDLLPAFGGHLVLEVELVEPSLFLGTAAGAADRLAAVIAAAIR